MAHSREWTVERNSRGCEFMRCEGQHVSVPELKMDPCINQDYLGHCNIGSYPYSVLFGVSEVCHVTEESGLRNIFSDGGFRAMEDCLLWWSLSVSEDDVASAENSFLSSLFPLQSRNDSQTPFLKHFTTSPAFQRESRYGNFRFTFDLRELLSSYSRQFCRHSSLVLRVLDTRFYRKEIMYSIVVHPAYVDRYQKYPRLPSDERSLCAYNGGHVLWRCQAPSDDLQWSLKVDKEQKQVFARPRMGYQYSVWDNVALAFHMEPDWVLHIDRTRLRQSASVCDVAAMNLVKNSDNQLSQSDASAILESVGSSCYYP